MMKIVQINVSCGIGSTGKICQNISELLTENGIENYVLFCSGKSNYQFAIWYTNSAYIKLQALKSKILGNYGFNSKFATEKLIKKLDRIQPDIVHIHNIHGHNCDLQRLFRYLKVKKIKIYWTFHDCWAFTGYCPHFTMAKCDKWKTGCGRCPSWRQMSWFFDRSAFLFNKKKQLFNDLDLTIVTPSQWLADLVKESFLKDYPVKVINNGIDLSVFKPTESDFREKYHIGNKFMLLGVAFGWDRRKGLDVFIELSKRLDPRQYQIVLVGVDARINRQLPDTIISIYKTQNQQELAKIYTAADLFVNPTREENYPTVNMEAIACGTPVLTFQTGGSPEMIDEFCGAVVNCNDIAALENEIIRICTKKPYSQDNCVEKAKDFDADSLFRKYLELYKMDKK